MLTAQPKQYRYVVTRHILLDMLRNDIGLSCLLLRWAPTPYSGNWNATLVPVN